METTPKLFSSHIISSFKSYYVVWKLALRKAAAQKAAAFKSYYVVWKRKKNMQE